MKRIWWTLSLLLLALSFSKAELVGETSVEVCRNFFKEVDNCSEILFSEQEEALHQARIACQPKLDEKHQDCILECTFDSCDQYCPFPKNSLKYQDCATYCLINHCFPHCRFYKESQDPYLINQVCPSYADVYQHDRLNRNRNTCKKYFLNQNCSAEQINLLSTSEKFEYLLIKRAFEVGDGEIITNNPESTHINLFSIFNYSTPESLKKLLWGLKERQALKLILRKLTFFHLEKLSCSWENCQDQLAQELFEILKEPMLGGENILLFIDDFLGFDDFDKRSQNYLRQLFQMLPREERAKIFFVKSFVPSKSKLFDEEDYVRGIKFALDGRSKSN